MQKKFFLMGFPYEETVCGRRFHCDRDLGVRRCDAVHSDFGAGVGGSRESKHSKHARRLLVWNCEITGMRSLACVTSSCVETAHTGQTTTPQLHVRLY